MSKEQADDLKEGQEIALVERTASGADNIMGILQLSEKYSYDKEEEAAKVYLTTDAAHPGVARLYEQGDVLLAGDVYLLNRPSTIEFPEFRHDPAQIRRPHLPPAASDCCPQNPNLSIFLLHEFYYSINIVASMPCKQGGKI